MSTHADCGEEIVWAKRSDDPDRFFPPLEFAGPAFIIDDSGQVQQVLTYRRHECDPDKMETWLELKRRQAELKGQSTEKWDARELAQMARDRDRENAYQAAMNHVCPRCDACVGERCVSLSTHLRRTGEIKYTRWPHPQRQELVEAGNG